jgi:hypothetical protein
MDGPGTKSEMPFVVILEVIQKNTIWLCYDFQPYNTGFNDVGSICFQLQAFKKILVDLRFHFVNF